MRGLLVFAAALSLTSNALAGPLKCQQTLAVEAEAAHQINRLSAYMVARPDPSIVLRDHAMSDNLVQAVMAVSAYVGSNCPASMEPSSADITALYVLVARFAGQLNADGVPDRETNTTE